MSSAGHASAPVHVLAAVITDGDRWLICQRPAHKRHGGLWEFPGGKLEPGEDHAGAARREMLEELGVEVTRVGAVLFSSRDPGSPFVIDFTPVEITGEPRPLEHAELRWVRPAAAASLPLAPADQAFVTWIRLQSSRPG
jgi:8-oxo-dGTP diphosphatase